MTTRQDLQQELEATKEAFHKLLEGIPPETYSLPSDNPAWNVGQVLYHMSLAPRMLGTDVRMITNQKWIYRLLLILVPKGLFDWLNKQLTTFGGRDPSPGFLAGQYDKAHDAAMRTLAGVADSDFNKQMYYPDWDPLLSGEVTLERLFRYVKVHFDAHAAQLERIVAGNQPVG